MFEQANLSLNYIFSNFAFILLIFARVGGMIFLIPIFTGRNVPTRTKIAFSFIIAMLIFSTGTVTMAEYNDSAVGYVFLVSKEVLTGLIMSFTLFLFFAIFYFAGQLIDFQIGFSMVSIFDPLSQIQVPVTGNFIYYIMTIFFIRTGALNATLAAMFGSFKTIPIGGLNLVSNAGLTSYFVKLTGDFLVSGLKIASPIIGTVLIVDISLGILVKAVPQMNVFVVGVPIKLLIGLVVFYVICPYFVGVWGFVYADMSKAIIEVMQGMVSK